MPKSDTTRVTFRIQEQKLRRWDAICTSEEELSEDDSEEFRELVKELPHLYRNRTELIRESVETQIFSEQQDEAVKIEQLSNEFSQFEAELNTIQDTLSSLSDSVRYISDNIEIDTTDLQTDIYQNLPLIEDGIVEFARRVQKRDEPDESLGRIDYIIDSYHDEPERKVEKAIEELEMRVDEVQRRVFELEEDGEADEFLVRVDNE